MTHTDPHDDLASIADRTTVSQRRPTRVSPYAAGYQAALVDIARALTDGGEPAVREWLANNMVQHPHTEGQQ